MPDTLISVHSVSKKFCRSLKRSLWYGLQDLGSEVLGKRHGGDGELRPDEFWAVKDVSFELKRGECLGLIGHNGAGKTTLLRMLNGLIKPDQGRIEMRGRVGALIALGAGFNPILTGRENIYVNASVLGLSKREIDEKIDEIIDFAEIGEFIDAPVQSYSSGMQVRLGFAVATALKPDILLLDEVLSVGDVRFQAKCFTRIAEIKSDSVMIFVSHTMSSVARIADRVLALNKGIPQEICAPQEGINKYFLKVESDGQVEQKYHEGNGDVSIKVVQVKSDELVDSYQIKRTRLSAFVEVESKIDVSNIIIDFTFKNINNISVAECPSILSGKTIKILKNKSAKIKFILDPVPLPAGIYYCSIYLFDSSCAKHYQAWINFKKIIIYNDLRFTSPMQLPAFWHSENLV